VELHGFKYPIQEVWIEEARRSEYKGIFFRKRLRTGYRLMVTFSVPYPSPESQNLIVQQAEGMYPICNDAIWLTTSVGQARKDSWLFYGEVTEPFPQSVRVAFKRYTSPSKH